MNMPSIVRFYFDADGRNDADTLICEQGVVVDEGTGHEGRDAIRSWPQRKESTRHRSPSRPRATITAFGFVHGSAANSPVAQSL